MSIEEDVLKPNVASRLWYSSRDAGNLGKEGITVTRSKREMKHGKKKAESSKQSPVSLTWKVVAGERLCSVLAPKEGQKSRSVDRVIVRDHWQLRCPIVQVSSQIADETQKKGKWGERAQNIFPQETNLGDPSLSASAIL